MTPPRPQNTKRVPNAKQNQNQRARRSKTQPKRSAPHHWRTIDYINGVGIAVSLTVAATCYQMDKQRGFIVSVWLLVMFIVTGWAVLRWQAISDGGANNRQGTPQQISSPDHSPSPRAWLTVKEAVLTKTLTIGETPIVGIAVINSGPGVAHNVRIAGNVLSRKELTADAIGTASTDPGGSTMVIAPGTQVVSYLDSTEPVTKQGQIDAWMTGARTLYSVGFIVYEGGSTAFCFKLSGKDLQFARRAEGGWAMAACEKWNTAK